jgi:hypothetical protein
MIVELILIIGVDNVMRDFEVLVAVLKILVFWGVTLLTGK